MASAASNEAALRRELEAYRTAVNFGEADQHLQRAQALLRPDTAVPVRLALEATQCLDDSYENEDRNGHWQQIAATGMVAASALGASTIQGEFFNCAGNVLMAKGELDGAGVWYDKALNLALLRHDQSLEADALNLRGTLASARGEYRLALLDLIRAREMFTAQGKTVDALSVTNDLAVLYSRLGDHRQALVYYQAVSTHMDSDAGPADRSALLGNMAASNEALGDHVLALEQIQRAKALAGQSGDPLQLAMTQRLAGRILISSGQPAAALVELLPAQRYLFAQGDRERAAQADLYAAMALAKLGRPAEALLRTQAARKQFEQSESSGNLNLAQTFEARLLSDQGRFREAFVMMAAAQESARLLAAQVNDNRLISAQVAADVREQKAENVRLVSTLRAQQSVLSARDRTRRWQRVALVASLAVLLVIAALAWRQFRRAQRMRDLSLTDELTGLPNRRSIFAFGVEQLKSARRIRDPLTLILLDIDHFKTINDQYGHDAGDLVLREIGNSLMQSVRHGSRLGRAGGEEFLAVLPHTDVEQALQAAERLRLQVAALRPNHSGQVLVVTASFGVVTMPSAAGDFDTLYAMADQALYAAKRRGRNCAVHFRELAPAAAIG